MGHPVSTSTGKKQQQHCKLQRQQHCKQQQQQQQQEE
jgi:hypothetical protein